jgi:hypothetical protein
MEVMQAPEDLARAAAGAVAPEFLELQMEIRVKEVREAVAVKVVVVPHVLPEEEVVVLAELPLLL